MEHPSPFPLAFFSLAFRNPFSFHFFLISTPHSHRVYHFGSFHLFSPHSLLCSTLPQFQRHRVLFPISFWNVLSHFPLSAVTSSPFSPTPLLSLSRISCHRSRLFFFTQSCRPSYPEFPLPYEQCSEELGYPDFCGCFCQRM